MLASGLALALVIGLGVTGWLYFTGRFGFGPLSAADKDAVTTISDGVAAPEWAGEDDRECAVQAIVEEDRSDALAKRGLIERDGDDWTYTEEWPTDDATTYFENLFDCVDDWPEQVGKAWSLPDTDCLSDIDTGTLASYFAADLLPLADTEEADLEEARTPAVEALDECYVEDPPPPEGQAESGYRSVKVNFTEPAVETGDVVIEIDRKGTWRKLNRSTVRTNTEQGGERGCVSARTVATFAWGSTATAEKEFCGKAKPRELWWTKAGNCTASPGCVAWELRYKGFASFDSVTARYYADGGDCRSVSGSCSDTITTREKGRGTIVTWSFPPSYNGTFSATADGLEAKIPN